jgi:hypothetical protein
MGTGVHFAGYEQLGAEYSAGVTIRLAFISERDWGNSVQLERAYIAVATAFPTSSSFLYTLAVSIKR